MSLTLPNQSRLSSGNGRRKRTATPKNFIAISVSLEEEEEETHHHRQRIEDKNLTSVTMKKMRKRRVVASSVIGTDQIPGCGIQFVMGTASEHRAPSRRVKSSPAKEKALLPCLMATTTTTTTPEGDKSPSSPTTLDIVAEDRMHQSCVVDKINEDEEEDISLSMLSRVIQTSQETGQTTLGMSSTLEDLPAPSTVSDDNRPMDTTTTKTPTTPQITAAKRSVKRASEHNNATPPLLVPFAKRKSPSTGTPAKAKSGRQAKPRTRCLTASNKKTEAVKLVEKATNAVTRILRQHVQELPLDCFTETLQNVHAELTALGQRRGVSFNGAKTIYTANEEVPKAIPNASMPNDVERHKLSHRRFTDQITNIENRFDTLTHKPALLDVHDDATKRQHLLQMRHELNRLSEELKAYPKVLIQENIQLQPPAAGGVLEVPFNALIQPPTIQPERAEQLPTAQPAQLWQLVANQYEDQTSQAVSPTECKQSSLDEFTQLESSSTTEPTESPSYEGRSIMALPDEDIQQDQSVDLTAETKSNSLSFGTDIIPSEVAANTSMETEALPLPAAFSDSGKAPDQMTNEIIAAHNEQDSPPLQLMGKNAGMKRTVRQLQLISPLKLAQPPRRRRASNRNKKISLTDKQEAKEAFKADLPKPEEHPPQLASVEPQPDEPLQQQTEIYSELELCKEEIHEMNGKAVDDHQPIESGNGQLLGFVGGIQSIPVVILEDLDIMKVATEREGRTAIDGAVDWDVKESPLEQQQQDLSGNLSPLTLQLEEIHASKQSTPASPRNMEIPQIVQVASAKSPIRPCRDEQPTTIDMPCPILVPMTLKRPPRSDSPEDWDADEWNADNHKVNAALKDEPALSSSAASTPPPPLAVKLSPLKDSPNETAATPNSFVDGWDADEKSPPRGSRASNSFGGGAERSFGGGGDDNPFNGTADNCNDFGERNNNNNNYNNNNSWGKNGGWNNNHAGGGGGGWGRNNGSSWNGGGGGNRGRFQRPYRNNFNNGGGGGCYNNKGEGNFINSNNFNNSLDDENNNNNNNNNNSDYGDLRQRLNERKRCWSRDGPPPWQRQRHNADSGAADNDDSWSVHSGGSNSGSFNNRRSFQGGNNTNNSNNGGGGGGGGVRFMQAPASPSPQDQLACQMAPVLESGVSLKYKLYEIDVSLMTVNQPKGGPSCWPLHSGVDPRLCLSREQKYARLRAHREMQLFTTPLDNDPRCKSVGVYGSHTPTSPFIASQQRADVSVGPMQATVQGTPLAGLEQGHLQMVHQQQQALPQAYQYVLQPMVAQQQQQQPPMQLITRSALPPPPLPAVGGSQTSSMFIYGCLQRSAWYQALRASIKIQINQSISELVRALNAFQRERAVNAGLVFDIFKLDCAGEVLELLKNLGLGVNAYGVLMDLHTGSTAPMGYAAAANTVPASTFGVENGVVAGSGGAGGGGAAGNASYVSTTYSFMQQQQHSQTI